MLFRVWLTDHAVRDLTELVEHISVRRGPVEANQVLGHIEQVLAGLRETPHRGACPRELLTLGIKEYREVFFKPYRILYTVAEADVYVLLIADGRRDFQTLLQRRLLEPRTGPVHDAQETGESR